MRGVTETLFIYIVEEVSVWDKSALVIWKFGFNILIPFYILFPGILRISFKYIIA